MPLLLRPARSAFSSSLLIRISTPKRLYSIDSKHPTPLIHITDLPAPNSGRIRVLSLNRPAARNAISRQLLHELRSHVDAVAAEYGPESAELPRPKLYGGAAGTDEMGPVRALILTSAVDSCFCAGADLKERKGFTADEYVVPCFQFRITAQW